MAFDLYVGGIGLMLWALDLYLALDLCVGALDPNFGALDVYVEHWIHMLGIGFIFWPLDLCFRSFDPPAS